jgi:hypothetical protein
MGRYEYMATLFYKGHEKLPKALAAGKLLDDRLSNAYLKVTSDIHFDMSAWLAYFDYDKLAMLPNYTENLITYHKTVNT